MPDLHGWITQQIDATETTARKAAALCGCHPPAPSWSFRDGDEPTDGRILIVNDPHPTLKRKIGRRWNSSYEGLFMAEHIVRHDPDAVLRRCEADRRILARHTLDPDAIWYEAPMCKGCGTYGYDDTPNVDNLNDCPELLDLGHAHGLTPEILATLDRPQEGERPEPRAFRIGPPARPTSSVPPALRGPNWPGPT
ncbi:DUF6221 family protein [Streptomyces sp. NPDC001315]|uniref:DUF6221 family protein n=1 Tax=Streptomyces sp. NPDC001315 TaxID=3364562 RepID=UPI0036AB8555